MVGVGRPARAALGAAAVVCAAWLVACVSTSEGGVVHVVRPGENVYRISLYYGVSVNDIVDANHIRDVSSVPIGHRLRIPRARRSAAVKSLAVVPSPAFRPAGSRELAQRESNLGFTWPVAGVVSSRFGWRGRKRHEGIDIPAKRGTAIRAAEAGRVIHSGGGLGAYGRVVIVKHAGRYSTVYAHNRKNRVKKGQFVEKGQVIAEVGTSGNASGPHLHFEVRRDRRAEDPLAYLP
jgi:murein DD-endopeptidase MepM/ murein hydrolase activator NlpD